MAGRSLGRFGRLWYTSERESVTRQQDKGPKQLHPNAAGDECFLFAVEPWVEKSRLAPTHLQYDDRVCSSIVATGIGPLPAHPLFPCVVG